jgi:hypothetical protein
VVTTRRPRRQWPEEALNYLGFSRCSSAWLFAVEYPGRRRSAADQIRRMMMAQGETSFNMGTNLPGRLRNMDLSPAGALRPLFEAVVNSIHSVDEIPGAKDGRIGVVIEREPQPELPFEKRRRGAPPTERILGFSVTDNGVGFNDANLGSFKMLDSDFKQRLGGRGVGRLLWLKAFEHVEIVSVFDGGNGQKARRSFSFSPNGVGTVLEEQVAADADRTTTVSLLGFKAQYRGAARKSVRAIATSVLEHSLWYFLRSGGAPDIVVKDEEEAIALRELYAEFVDYSSEQSSFELKERLFQVSHVKMRAAGHAHSLSWCADNRVVDDENLVGKVPGLHGRLSAGEEDSFNYACFVTSAFFDERVRPERSAFNIPEVVGELFDETEIGMGEIRSAVVAEAARYLEPYLADARRAGREHVERFVSTTPRYKPMLA